MKTWVLWNLAIKNQMSLKAVHVAGKDNVLADQLSRHKVLTTEWSLKTEIVQNIFMTWGHPLMDLFASESNHQTEIFCTWIPSSRAFATDALSISWENMFAYAYPPICLIPKVLNHMLQHHCEIILIAPQWPRRHWYTQLLQLLIACPIQLPVVSDLLVQPKTQIYHPKPELFKLTAWRLSTDSSKRKAFLNSLDNYSEPHGGQVLRKTTMLSFESSIAGVVQGKLIPLMHL